jgi:carbon monoxide dehydrogenase subunit G
MIIVERSFTADIPPEQAVAYLKEFAHTEEWDPGTESCVRLDSGAVAVGSTWRNVSVFRGRRTELRYALTRMDADHLTFVGENASALTQDDMAFSPDGAGTRVTYRAQLRFKGVLRLATPLLRRSFEALADEVEVQLPRTLSAQRPLRED